MLIHTSTVSAWILQGVKFEKCPVKIFTALKFLRKSPRQQNNVINSDQRFDHILDQLSPARVQFCSVVYINC